RTLQSRRTTRPAHRTARPALRAGLSGNGAHHPSRRPANILRPTRSHHPGSAAASMPNAHMKTVLITAIALAGLAAATEPSPKHGVVFQEEGRFGGWPANHGIWSWGDEILVGFEVGYFKASDRGHSIDYSR